MDGSNGHFQPGEKVIYPQFGLGTVAEITSKSVSGTDLKFYRLEFPLNQMEILVPVKRAAENGLRKIMTESQADEVLEFLSSPTPCERPQQWHRWRKQAQEQLKSGDPLEVAKIFCYLVTNDNAKGLSFTERKILSQVELMLGSELAAVKGLSTKETETMLASYRKGLKSSRQAPQDHQEIKVAMA